MTVNREPLDPKRLDNAKRRAKTAMVSVRYHEKQAAMERAKAETIARTWGFDLKEISDE